MVVRDDDPGFFQVRQHVVRNQFALLIITVRIVGLKNAKTVLDGDAGRNNKETGRESATLGTANRVNGLPGDQHRHDSCLASPGCQFKRQPLQTSIHFDVGTGQMVEKSPTGSTGLRCNLCQPDDRLHRFDLAEEGPNVIEPVVPPMLEQSCRFRRHPPLFRIWQLPPSVDLNANAVDDFRQVVFLAFRSELAGCLGEDNRRLF